MATFFVILGMIALLFLLFSMTVHKLSCVHTRGLEHTAVCWIKGK